jgi:mRNA interferase HigB
MRVISVSRLRDYWTVHAECAAPLQAWVQVVKPVEWASFVELRATFPSADLVGRLTVFNIKGDDFRLITRVEYAKHAVYIRSVWTHSEYDMDEWKNDPWF